MPSLNLTLLREYPNKRRNSLNLRSELFSMSGLELQRISDKLINSEIREKIRSALIRKIYQKLKSEFAPIWKFFKIKKSESAPLQIFFLI